MNGTWIIETLLIVGVALVAVRSVSYGIFEWKHNKAGALMMIVASVLMTGLCVRSLFW